jgi:hypothetical protein
LVGFIQSQKGPRCLKDTKYEIGDVTKQTKTKIQNVISGLQSLGLISFEVW